MPKCPVVRARHLVDRNYAPSADDVCPVLPHRRREYIMDRYGQVKPYVEKAAPVVTGAQALSALLGGPTVQAPRINHNSYFSDIGFYDD